MQRRSLLAQSLHRIPARLSATQLGASLVLKRPSQRSFSFSLPARLSATSPCFQPPPLSRPAVSVDGTSIAKQGAHVADLSDEGKSDGETKEEEEDLGLVKGEDGVVRGKLSPTNSHLLRLTLPLPTPDRPCAFVLHPTQPLSYVARLISAEMSPESLGDVEFRGFGRSDNVRWSDATDIGDFVHQAARVKQFHIVLTPPSSSGASKPEPLTLEVLVPSFSARTHFLRARLARINESLRELGDLKALCDKEARRGARRVALGGLGGLLAYWGVVAKLSFDPSIGWDVMEPVTYLIGHGALVGGYCYFLLHSREPGYNAVLDRSVSTRQAKLYEKHGFDVELHRSLTKEGTTVRDEIKKIAGEYGIDEWKERKSEVEESERLEERSAREGKEKGEEKKKEQKVRERKKEKGDEDEDD